MPRKPRPAPPGVPADPALEAPDLESMIRVDHAGEYGAVRIYEGQLAVLKHRRGARSQPPRGAYRLYDALCALQFGPQGTPPLQHLPARHGRPECAPSAQNVVLMLKCTSPIDSPLRRSSLKPWSRAIGPTGVM